MERYDLPVLFTENEREKYVDWALKKEKILFPTAVLAALLDVFVLLGTVFYLWEMRTEPVSYTHLDVYKRQQKELPGKHSEKVA